MRFLILLTLVGTALAQWDPYFESGRAGIVHLFEWHWDTIADECETFLGPNKFAGVQISPPNENRIIDSRPWWERYQPISYVLGTRSGDRAALQNMVDRCNAVGVRIYADIVINHMCGGGGTGTGTAGTYFDANTKDFPAVPYSAADFNDGNCYTSSGGIENYGDANQVRNCRLVSLLDLNQGKDYVRGKIIDFMNDLTSLGIAGFRVDACKHMWPNDLEVIFGALNDLPTSKGFSGGSRPFIYQEVIDQGGEPITASQYLSIGRVTEFKYGINLYNNKDKLQYLSNFGESWGMMPDGSALVFLNNHDNQRSHGGGGNVITFEDPYNLKIFTAFMMAWPYGVPRVMSSYYFSNFDEGPPGTQRSVNADGSCGNGWVCEHRWRQIKNLAAFSAVAAGQSVQNWWANGNQIAFSRGSKAFLAINKERYSLFQYLQTGMPSGDYCDVISGDFENNTCTGQCVTVDGSGYAHINVPNNENPFLAIHVNALCNCEGGDCSSNTVPPSTGGGDCTSCNNCSSKVDCGYMGITKSECEANECSWCPISGGNDPWCIYTSDWSIGSNCFLVDSAKQDCGYLGIDESECENGGCCWAESNNSGVPWCFYPNSN
ncbi:alpha-amylase B-like [Clavelina lepadiformis]|uniref:alpha-amylase B-like n=1 Tax=Clavelina lepadiformis TaxID=159417 RepID=UPI00404343F3